MHQQTHRALAVAALLVLALAATPGAVTAAEQDYFGGLITVDDSGTFTDVDVHLTELTSAVARTYARLTTDAGQASSYANATAATFNDHNSTLEAYVNDRLNATTSVDVIAVSFTDRDGGNVTYYVTATVSGDAYQNATMTATTSRTVDERVYLDWYASKHADAELQQFVDEFAEPGKNVTTSYKATMLAEYGGSIRGTLWNGSGS